MSDVTVQHGARGWWGRSGAFALPCAVFVAIASLRMNQSLWYDELWRTRQFLNERTLHDMLWGDVHNPLYNALMYVWIGVVGDSEVAIRVPSLVCAVAVIVLAAWWARRLIGECGAWVTGLFLAVSPVMVWHGTEAKNTMMATLGAVWCVMCTERAARWNGEQTKWWRHPAVWLGLGLMVAGWTSWNGLFAAVCALLAMMTAWKSVPKRNWKPVALAWCGALMVLAPILVYKSTRVPSLMRAHPRHLDWREVVLFVTNWLPTGNAWWPVQPYEETVSAFANPRVWFTIGMGAVVVGLLVMGVREFARRGAAAWVARPMWIGLVVLCASSAALDHWYGDRRWYIYQERNLLWMEVCFALVATAAVVQMGRWPKCQGAKNEKKWRSGKLAVCLFAATAIALPLVGTARLMTTQRNEWTVYKPNPDWRGAAEMIVADGGERARVFEEEAFQLDPLWYYRGSLVRESVPRGADIAAELQKLVDQGAVYVVSQQHRWPYRRARFERPDLVVHLIGERDGVMVYRVELAKRN